MSLRARLIGTSLLTLALGLGLLLAVGNTLLAVETRGETTRVLEARADAQLAALAVTRRTVRLRPSPGAPLEGQGWVLGGGRVLARPARAAPGVDAAAIALGRAGRSGERDAGDDVRLLARPARAGPRGPVVGAVVVGTSVESVEHLRVAVLLGSLVLAALILLAGGLVIRRAVDGALHPVARMTADAESWSAHDLERRFALGRPVDELTGLAATLDGLLARIAASRRHEQRFASEVAHELRTPLAGLRGRAELALAASGPGVAEERERALRDVVGGAERLAGTLDGLVAIARRELDPADGVVDLRALAAEHADLRLSAPRELPLAAGDPETVRRALQPLVENARRHARTTVRLELSADEGRVRLAVLDDGPGLPPELVERAFVPGVQGEGSGGGAGLGLPLARRLARACGGDVSATPGPGGRVVLELPAVGAGG